MPKYAILSETDAGKLGKKYEVILEADDGYQETQVYIGNEQTLVSAAKHMNEEHVKQMEDAELEAPSPVFVVV